MASVLWLEEEESDDRHEGMFAGQSPRAATCFTVPVPVLLRGNEATEQIDLTLRSWLAARLSARSFPTADRIDATTRVNNANNATRTVKVAYKEQMTMENYWKIMGTCSLPKRDLVRAICTRSTCASRMDRQPLTLEAEQAQKTSINLWSTSRYDAIIIDLTCLSQGPRKSCQIAYAGNCHDIRRPHLFSRHTCLP